MRTFKKTFDFYSTDKELDDFVFSILHSPEVDPEDDIEVLVDRDDDHRHLTLKVFDRVLN